MVLLTAIYLGLSRRMWQKCTRINANFKATFDISIGEVNESRLNVHFGVIIRKVTSLLTLILVASVKNTKHHIALINAEDGMGGLDRKNLPEGLCSYSISGVTPRLEPDGKDLLYKSQRCTRIGKVERTDGSFSDASRAHSLWPRHSPRHPCHPKAPWC